MPATAANRESGSDGVILPSRCSAAVGAVAALQQLLLAKPPGHALLLRTALEKQQFSGGTINWWQQIYQHQ